MTRTLRLFTGVCGCALAACQHHNGVASASMPAGTQQSHFVPSQLVGLGRCPTDPTGAGFTVRVLIPRDLSEIFMTLRAVRVSPQSETGDDELIFSDGNRSTANVVQPNSDYATNPFHIDMASIPKGANGYTRVRVMLLNPRLTFLEDATRKPAIRGVAQEENGPGKAWLCQWDAPIEEVDGPVKGKRNVVTFYVNRITKKEAPINFLIGPDKRHGATAGEQTPILIDPKVKNDG